MLVATSTGSDLGKDKHFSSSLAVFHKVVWATLHQSPPISHQAQQTFFNPSDKNISITDPLPLWRVSSREFNSSEFVAVSNNFFLSNLKLALTYFLNRRQNEQVHNFWLNYKTLSNQEKKKCKQECFMVHETLSTGVCGQSYLTEQMTFPWASGYGTAPAGEWQRPEAVGIYPTVSSLM